MVYDSGHVKVSVLIGELNSRISYVTAFGIVVISPAW